MCVTAFGGVLVNLTPDWDLIPDAPLYSADGATLYFGGAVGGDTQLFRLSVAGGQPHQITTGDRNLGGFSFSRNFERVAYTGGQVNQPTEAYAARIDGSVEARLSTLNAGWIDGVELAPAERIHFPSRDGTQIEGWIMHQMSFRPASRPERGSAPSPSPTRLDWNVSSWPSGLHFGADALKAGVVRRVAGEEPSDAAIHSSLCLRFAVSIM
jgi:dipeptidyl aminopeptidase/acylaminoacyl peptidase